MEDSKQFINKAILSEPDLKSLEYDVDYSQENSDLRVTLNNNKQEKKDKDKTSDELYAALDDKNRDIETLNRRLTNQQIQLAYYLHKNLTTETVLEFSSKCFPQLAEDTTHLSLAMYKFIRDTGGKTRLAQLREKLCEYNNRVHKAILRQELLMRQHFNFDEEGGFLQMQIEGERSEESISNEISMMESKDNLGDSDEDKEGLKYMRKAFRMAQMEISSQLLSVTMQIKRELQKFRLCSEKVIKLEEERNSLVDRVFSLPAEQRYGAIEIAMIEENRPKTRKANDIRETPESTAASMTSVSTNTTEDGMVDILQKEKVEHNKDLGGALRDMETEALQLLIMSEKQKNEFVIALEESRIENENLRERLKDLEETASDERVLLLQDKCFIIEREVNEMKRSMEVEQQEKERVIRQMASELRTRDINEISYQQEILTLESNISILTEERDLLQKEIDDQRKHRTDLVNQKTNTDEMYHHREDVASQVQSQEVDELTDLVVLQEEQIKDLLTIMSGLGIDSRSHSLCESKSIISDKDYSNEKSISIDALTLQESENKFRSSQVESLDSGVFTSKNQQPITVNEEDKVVEEVLEELLDENPNIFFDSSSDLSNVNTIDDRQRVPTNQPSASMSQTPTDMKTEFCDSENKSEHSSRPRSRKRRYCMHDRPQQKFESSINHPQKYDSHIERRQGVATTSLRIETCDKDGKSESMHAVLECSSPVDGLLEMDNASKLHLRLQCTSPQRDYSLLTINENYEESCPFCPEKNVSGDHKHKRETLDRPSTANLELKKEAKLYLSKQLTKLKNQLQTEKGSNTSNSVTRKDIVNNLNEIYSNLFEENVTSQSLT